MNYENTSPKHDFDPINTAFLILTPILALLGSTLYFIYADLPFKTGLLFLIYMIVTGLSITAGYHRLFSHKTYKATWPVRLFWLCFGAGAFQNSALKWSSDHREHHQHVDTENDPYNIKNGFWYAHILWILYKSKPFDDKPVADLKRDPLICFQHQHIYKLGFIFGFLLPTLIASTWGDALGGLIFAGFVRIVLNHHFTFFINSLAHTWGTQPYNQNNTARDNPLMAFFTYGEGYHNFHHAFPSDYRNGIYLYQWDPSKWTIWFLEKMGLVKNLKRIPKSTLYITQIKKQENTLLTLLKLKHKYASNEWQHAIEQARSRFEDACIRFYALKAEYKSIKKQKWDSWQSHFDHKRDALIQAQIQFQSALQNWRTIYKMFYRYSLQLKS